MDIRKTALLLCIFSIAVFNASGYEGSGGVGSDGGNDPILDPPEYNENPIYDLQGSWIFEGKSAPDSSGPSIFFGSQVKEELDDGTVESYPDDGTEGLGNEITLQYVQNSDDEWGNGSLETVTISQSDWYLNSSGRDGFAALIRPPHPDAGSASNRCGDTVHNDGNDESSCPEDYGLPSDSADSGSEDSTYDSTETITHTFNDQYGEYDINDIGSVSGVGDSGDDTDDFISYDVDLTGGSRFYAKEHDTDDTDDITGPNEGGFTDKIYEDDNWQSTPDFYQEGNGDEIWMKYVRVSGTTSISDSQNPVKTYDLSIGTYDENYQKDGDSIHTSCTNVDGNYTCEESTDEYCIDANSNTVTNHHITTETITLNADGPQEYTTSSASGNGISTSSSSSGIGFQVDVTRNIKDGTTEEPANECTSWSPDHSCALDGSDDEGSSCELSGQEDTYSNQLNDYTRDDDSRGGEGYYYDGWDDHYRDYRYETLTFDEAKIFDINPAENPAGSPTDSGSLDHPADALFWNDNFKGETYGSGNADDNDLSVLSRSGNAFYSWGITENSEDIANDPSVSLSSFSIDVDGTDFHSVRDSFETYDVDGPRGLGNGYVAMRHEVVNEGTDNEQKSNNWHITGTTQGFAAEETSADGSSASFVTESQVENMMKSKDIQCPGDSLYCVAAVDLHLDDLNQWSSTDPSDGVDLDITANGPYVTSESMGVCNMYNKISDESGSLDDIENVECQYDNVTRRCHTAGTRMHTMEGPEVDEDAMKSSDSEAVQDDRRHCVEHSQCVLHDNNVSEGTVANVAREYFQGYPGYEEGGDSPDWEVCLNINDDSSYHQFGGQWYDLDNPVVGEYLRGEIDGGGDGSQLVSGADTSSFNPDPSDGKDHIENYWLENPNPQHDMYNPKGGMEGTALVAHCGPGIDCGEEEDNTRGDVSSRKGNYFSFFQEYSRDEDYHPQGKSEETNISHRFEGVLTMTRKHPENNQLSPGHYDYSVYEPEWYRNTEIGEDQAVQYAYAVNRSWVLDSTGVPYPPWGESGSGYASSSRGVHYRENYTGPERQDRTDSTVQKTSRAFGNSLAVVAQQDISTGASQNDINKGDGFWIDPDNIREHFNNGNIDDGSGSPDGWKNFVSFKMDLTGPDSGLGWDYSGSTEKREGGNVVFTDIDWERDDSGNLREGLQQPMCGDDRYEYLIEEMGESSNSEQYTGSYGCSPRQDICYSSEVGGFTEVGSYTQTGEPTEDVGRYKQDEEYCGTNDEGLGVWYDQDLKQKACNENSLYGSSGVRWFDKDYIQEHPHAVTGGIDDSWNNYTSQHGYSSWESLPNKGGSWDLSEETPVPTGTNRSKTASLGFCGGDDGSEYLTTQECNTNLCETKRRVQGVAKVPGSCVFDGDQSSYPSNVNDRRLYQPGEEITINLESQRTIVCFDGAWHDKSPISFNQQKLDLPLNEEVDVSFQIVNVRNQEVTYDVSMIDPLTDELSVYQLSQFKEKNGDSFRVTLGPQSSKEYQATIRGGTLDIDGDESDDRDKLRLRAEAVNLDELGEDSLTVDVVNNNRTGTGSRAEPESVPGVSAVQLIVMTAMASVLFFIQS